MWSKKTQEKLKNSVQKIASDYCGHVLVSDLDKTYLETDTHSLTGIWKAATDSPEKKKTITGFNLVLRAVRREQAPPCPLFFLSASPPQIEGKLLTKLHHDGVEHDGLILKNQLKHLRNAEFSRLKNHLSYKLMSLLLLSESLPKGTRFLLFGDDSESDALIYVLFAKILSMKCFPLEVSRILQNLQVPKKESLQIALKRRAIKNTQQQVDFIFINRACGVKSSLFSAMSSQIAATDNALQIALILYEKNIISKDALISIALSFNLKKLSSKKLLLKKLISGVRKGFYKPESILELWEKLGRRDKSFLFFSKKQFEKVDFKMGHNFSKITWSLDKKNLSLSRLLRILENI